jgi:hypothetical protein
VPRVDLLTQGLVVETLGLTRHGHMELRASVANSDLLPDCHAFLRFVVTYLAQTGASILSGQTLAYGYWLVKFQAQERMPYLHVWEYQADATDFVEGVSLTLQYWREQHATCDKAGAPFTPPRADQMVAVSDGVYEGDSVQGVRYPSPSHMSGWWVTTDRYNGDVKTLEVVHLYHLTCKRPELAKYIAFPPGYRFSSNPEVIRFDQTVAPSQ